MEQDLKKKFTIERSWSVKELFSSNNIWQITNFHIFLNIVSILFVYEFIAYCSVYIDMIQVWQGNSVFCLTYSILDYF